MAIQRRTGSYIVPSPHAILAFKGQLWVTPGDVEVDPPHDEPTPSVTAATRLELFEGFPPNAEQFALEITQSPHGRIVY